MALLLRHGCIVCVFFVLSYGSDQAELEKKFSELLAKGLISQERLEQLKRELLEESSDETDSASSKESQGGSVKMDSNSHPGPGVQAESGPSHHPRSARAPDSGKEDDVKMNAPAGSEEDLPRKAEADDKPSKKRRRPESMEESMRAYGIDPDAIAKMGQRREPTDVNAFVAAALQASQAQETARQRDVEVLEDQEEASKEKELQDDEVIELEGSPEKNDRSMPDLGEILPDQVKGKLAGILGRLGNSLDPEASSLLSQLGLGADMPSGDAGEGDEENDGTTENLAELMESLRAGRAGSVADSPDFEALETQRKEAEERREKAAAERKQELARREAARIVEHEKHEAEMKERDEQRKKDREEFEEGRRKHNEYMQKMEERKKKAEERRAEMEAKREEREDRMAAALKMAAEHIDELKGKQQGTKKTRDDL